MRNTLVESDKEYLPTLQETKQGTRRTRTTSMDKSDSRINDERQNHSQRSAAAAAARQDAISGNHLITGTGRRELEPEAGSYQTYTNTQPVQTPQMSSAAGPVYTDPHTTHTNPQQQAPQHSGYEQYAQGQSGAQQTQGYSQQQATQLPAYHQYASQGYTHDQNAAVQQPQPYPQNTFMQQGQSLPTQSYTMQTPYIQAVPSRDPLERPVVKLSVNLIDTYKRINEAYYANRKQATEETPQTDGTRNEPRGQGVHNHGWDDEHYDYILNRGEMVQGRYRLQERIGKGSFGQVVRAFDTETKKDVAIKIIKSRRPFMLQARTEIELLVHLRERDTDDQNNIVRLLSHFMYRNHQCLVFEMLSLNLYELLRNTQFDGVSLNLIRKFAKQILKALQFLGRSDVDIIHCDLKPENILLRHPKRSGVKVIDFGSSCRSNTPTYSYIQSRFYRSPEVLLGLPYSVAIDMWSLGCILVEMHTGEPLFSGSDQVDQVQKIVKILGMVPDEILDRMGEQQRNQFFERGRDGRWALKRTEGQPEPILPSENPRESLKEVLRESNDSPGNYDVFVELIYKMLSYKPEDRVTPDQALGHQFIVAGQ